MMSVNTKSCPYVDVGRNGFTYVYIVGRAGTIVWRGNQTVRDKEFLEAVGEALAVKETPPIGKALAPALDAAGSARKPISPGLCRGRQRADRASKAFAKKLGTFVKKNARSVAAREAETLLARFDDS